MGFALRVWALNKVSFFACFILRESGFKTLGGNLCECIPTHLHFACIYASLDFVQNDKPERNEPARNGNARYTGYITHSSLVIPKKELHAQEHFTWPLYLIIEMVRHIFSFHRLAHVRQSKTVLDSGFHKLDSGLFVNGTWIPGSSPYWDSGFLELYSGF